MKHLLKITIAVLVMFSLPVFASEITTPDPQPEQLPLLISELQTASTENATDEFVEIYNSNDVAIDLSGWSLQYKSAAGNDWLSRATLSGQIEPRGYYLVGSQIYSATANLTKSLGLASGGGHIRLLAPIGAELSLSINDTLGWGSADSPEGHAAPAPDASQSLKRRFDEDGKLIDSQDNLADFLLSDTPSPTATSPQPITDEPVAEEDQPSQPNDHTDTTVQEVPTENKIYPKLNITELFVNPDMPLLDANDEFVEIYNPNDSSAELGGYVLETGSNFTYSFTLPSYKLAPKTYVAYYSRQTSLALSNSGGRARISDPNGKVVFETPSYQKAREGEVFALVNGSWIWSDLPTPGKPNLFTASTTEPASGNKQSSAQESNTTGKVLSVNDSSRSVYQEPPTAPTSEVDTTVVAGVGALAVLYAGYEYRYDVGNRLHQLRRYFKARKKNRA